MNSCLSLVDYSSRGLCSAHHEHDWLLRPPCVTIGHCIFQLQRDPETGRLTLPEASGGMHRRSPRSLLGICLNTLVSQEPLNPSPHHPCPHPPWSWSNLPSDLYPRLLTEALLQRDCPVICRLIAHWPSPHLVLKAALPQEEDISADSPRFLTAPVDGRRSGASILDAIVSGLLTRHPDCHLKELDLTGFCEDRRISIELARLPILWLPPKDRIAERLLPQVRNIIQLKHPDRVQHYLNKIAIIYANVDQEFKHGQKFDPVTIYLDCMMSVDEVAIGLSLQHLTPFQFSCKRLWMQKGVEIYLPPVKLISIFDPLKVTHFELEDFEVCLSSRELSNSLQWISSLRNLVALSLPTCVTPGPGLRCLNKALLSLRRLKRLSLAHSNLRGHLRFALSGLSQAISYLNLQDCRLIPEDLEFLCEWRHLESLDELNLSHNDLSSVAEEVLHTILRRSALEGRLVCLSMAYTSLSTDCLQEVVELLAGQFDDDDEEDVELVNLDPRNRQRCQASSSPPVANNLKVICLQRFTPLPMETLHYLLHLASQLPVLQLLYLLPAVYAFPGSDQEQRKEARADTLHYCRHYLEQRGKPEIVVR